MDVLSGANLNSCGVDVFGANGLIYSESLPCAWSVAPYAFFGLTSDQTITRVVVHALRVNGADALEGVDNLAFGLSDPTDQGRLQERRLGIVRLLKPGPVRPVH